MKPNLSSIAEVVNGSAGHFIDAAGGPSRLQLLNSLVNGVVYIKGNGAAIYTVDL